MVAQVSCELSSGDGAKILAQVVPIDARSKPFDFFVGLLPDGKSAREQATSFGGKDENAAAAIRGIGGYFDEAATLEGLQGCCQSGSIHRQQGSDGPHRWRLWSIERHEQRKLPVGEVEGTQFVVETAGKGARRTLHMKTKATVLDHQRCFEGQRFCT